MLFKSLSALVGQSGNTTSQSFVRLSAAVNVSRNSFVAISLILISFSFGDSRVSSVYVIDSELQGNRNEFKPIDMVFWVEK